MRKILMLGGSSFQIPAIKYAKNSGYYVIVADYLDDNPGQKYADEYHNISIVDEEKILALSKKLNIDGIVSYAADPGAPTAAYVAEKLNLPGNPYESVKILQRKDLFRKFLSKNGFNVPNSKSFKNLDDAKAFSKIRLGFNPIIIKPVDSSGSKGVSKLYDLENFQNQFNNAIKYSMSKTIIIEDFIEKAIYQMDGDGFVWNNKLVFACFGNQHNDLDCNPYVPMGISFPYIQSKKLQQKAFKIVDSIMNLLDMKVGGLNIEYLTDTNDNVYILEIGPRSGGNLIPEVIKYSTGVDLIAASVEGAMGKDMSYLKMKPTNGYYSSYILHSKNDGIVSDVIINDNQKFKIIEQNIMTKKNDSVKKFNGSNNTLGTFILKFYNLKQMTSMMNKMTNYINIELK